MYFIQLINFCKKKLTGAISRRAIICIICVKFLMSCSDHLNPIKYDEIVK